MSIADNAVVLLGAGASAEAGVPTTRDMTKQLAARIAGASYGINKLESALNFVCGALIAYDAAEGSDPFEGLDVERVFAAIQLLAERRTLEVSPFVAAWHPAVDVWDESSKPAPPFFAKKFTQALTSSFSNYQLPQVLTELIDSRITTAATGETYASLARRMLGELRELVSVKPRDTYYLLPLVLCGKRSAGMTIATLNYDLTVETAAKGAGVDLTTGIESWLEGARWSWPQSGIRLLKLHGSINWAWSCNDREDGELPRDVIEVIDNPELEHEDPALVFGNRGKLKAKGPFLGLLAEFEEQLSNADQLIVIGYSFRDDHVNEVIRNWTLERKGNRLLVVDPNWPGENDAHTGFQRELEVHLVPPHWKDPPTFNARLEIVRSPCSEALEALGFPEVDADY